MSLALVAALALTAPGAAASCSWDKPGMDPFMGNVPAAVDRYTDIPEAVRERLKARMRVRNYDEIATIRRDSISGRERYDAEIRDMHFGQGRVCRTITRAKWTPEMVERGLVYCESEHCIIVPTVCRNVSRITRLSTPGRDVPGLPPIAGLDPVEPAGLDMAPLSVALLDGLDTGPLLFDPPGAGNPPSSDDGPLSGFDPLPGSGGFIPFGGPPRSALDVPPGVLPPGGGTIGGGGVLPPVPPASPPPTVNTPVPEIPEPSTWLLWLAGLAGLAWVRRRQRG